MARLVSYRVHDEGRYSTFGCESECNSSENLTEPRRKTRIVFSKSAAASKAGKSPTRKLAKSMARPIRAAATAEASTSRQSAANTLSQRARSANIPPKAPPRPPKSQCCCPAVGRCLDYLCCCFCCTRKRCACHSTDNDDEEVDVDAYFESYKNEMRLKERTSQLEAKQKSENAYRSSLPPPNNGKAESTPCPSATRHQYWNWNDSLRSNSDKFLETLEYDMDGEQSLKRNHRYPVMSHMKGLCFLLPLSCRHSLSRAKLSALFARSGSHVSCLSRGFLSFRSIARDGESKTSSMHSSDRNRQIEFSPALVTIQRHVRMVDDGSDTE